MAKSLQGGPKHGTWEVGPKMRLIGCKESQVLGNEVPVNNLFDFFDTRRDQSAGFGSLAATITNMYCRKEAPGVCWAHSEMPHEEVSPERDELRTNSRTKVTQRRLSAAGRRRIAEAAGRRWAEIRATSRSPPNRRGLAKRKDCGKEDYH